jgi:hypothetical protein
VSAELQTALVNEVMDLSNLFKQNCALKHGLPKPGDNRVSSAAVDQPPKQDPPVFQILNQIPAATTANTATPSPGATAAADPSKLSLAKTVAPWLLSAAVGGAAIPAYQWLTQDTAVPLPESPQQNQSLLDALQNQGFHLDPERGAQWQTP